MNTLNDIPPYLRDSESSRWTSRGGVTAILVLVEWQEPGVTIIEAEEVGGAYRGYSRTVFLSLVIGVVVTRILVIAGKHIVFAIKGVELQSGFSKGLV